jgi:hypothetical protein
MFFRFRHHQLRGLVFGIIGAVPVDDHAIDAAADHVIDLIRHLCRVGGAIADVHVVRLPKPDHQVSIDLGGRSRIKQGVNIDLADVPGAAVPVSLWRKATGRARVIRRLSAQGGGGYNVVGTGETHTG